MQGAETIHDAAPSFWDAHPCDGHPDVPRRMSFRYDKEPWLPGLLEQIARHDSILEVGCGQGTDALYCCRRMQPGSRYVAVDCSAGSITRARESIAQLSGQLAVEPQFLVGHGEHLDLPGESFDCAASLGVLHHTPDIRAALNELYRVLKPGGVAFVTLYRRSSPKLFVANLLRVFSRCVDAVTRREAVLYGWSRKLGSDHALGTMLLECLGVPILNCYSRRQVAGLFSRFGNVTIDPVGMGFSFRITRRFDAGFNPLGAQWLVVARKGPSVASHRLEDRPA